jgi:hypothetical protein
MIMGLQERGFPDDTAVRTTEPDVVEYYKLTAAGENAGLFRENEYDQAAEQAIKEAEEQAADAKENEHYYRLARLRYVLIESNFTEINFIYNCFVCLFVTYFSQSSGRNTQNTLRHSH